MESKIRHQYDGDLALRAPGSAAMVADGNTTAVSIYPITDSPYDAVDGRFGIGSFDCVLYVSAIDTTSGSETYTLNFQTVDANGANPVTHETVVITSGLVGEPLVYAFHPATLAVADADAASFRINVDVGGSTPSITFYAYLAPHSHY
jgi:hypothetical protein